MMMCEQPIGDSVMLSPNSPPGMTTSKSSKTSSFHSLSSDDNSVISDVNNFEEIGLDDDHVILRDRDTDIKTLPNRFSPSYSADLRTVSQQQQPRLPLSRDLARTRPHSALSLKERPVLPSLHAHVQSVSLGRSASTNALVPGVYGSRNRSPVASAPLPSRRRTPSPHTQFSRNAKKPVVVVRPRRSSWQSSRERKTSLELELECDEDEGDDIPEGLILDNVPISPRPPSERSLSVGAAGSKAPSPDRTTKDKSRSVGNGTPPVAAAQGSLRSPTWKAEGAKPVLERPNPLKMRAKSWTAALSDLNKDAKELTEKLEEHADEMQQKLQRSSTGSLPSTRRVVTDPFSKPRHKSALPELPPLRRSNIMIDPLPVSKEKEAVLSRTRPSWLPPKDPAEEKRHLREYQKMMANSISAEQRREASRKARSECRDTAANGLIQIWEKDILPRWNEAVRERRTRELWWKGIAPRSRGAVWTRAIGNDLGLTEASFHAALERAHELEAHVAAHTATQDQEQLAECFKTIRKDIEQHTWQDLKIFQTGAPLHEGLKDILMAYAMYRSDIGYVAGCNTIAALLLLNLPDTASAFVALANVLNRPLPLSFYASDAGAKASVYNLLLKTLSTKSSALYYHITNMPDHDPDYYLNGLFKSLFTGQLALDQASRLWDVYFFEGDAVLVRAGVAFLMEREVSLLSAEDVHEVRAILSNSGERSQPRQPVVAQVGEEDRWMQMVRNAGKF